MTTTTSTRVAHRPALRSALGVVSVAGALLLSACASGSPSSDTPATLPAGSPVASTQPTPVAPAQQVKLGTAVTLPTDTFEVSNLLDHAAPDSPKPGTPGTHWASFEVNHCATAASSQGRWAVALADGSTAPEPNAWPDGLPQAIFPNGDPYAAGDCEKGRVYIEMPDSGVATAVILQPKVAGPARPEVRWVVDRTSAAS